MVLCLSAMWATFSLVPTPSALATSRKSLPGDLKSPPKEPISLTTPGVFVDLTFFLIRCSEFIMMSMSTPACAYALFFFAIVVLRKVVKWWNLSWQAFRTIEKENGFCIGTDLRWIKSMKPVVFLLGSLYPFEP